MKKEWTYKKQEEKKEIENNDKRWRIIEYKGKLFKEK